MSHRRFADGAGYCEEYNVVYYGEECPHCEVDA